MKYEALLAYDIACYATVEFKADNDEAALEEAKRQWEVCQDEDPDLSFEPEWGSVSNERIVSVSRLLSTPDGPVDERINIVENIELDPDPLQNNAFALLTAAKGVLEWAALMGGWEAPCWRELESVIAKCERRELSDAR